MPRWLKIVLGSVLLIVVALAALPWWLGAALRPVGRNYGLQFASYERVGYGRFALRDAKFERAGVLVTAQRVELDTPLFLLTRPAQTRAALEQWRVVLAERKTPANTPEKSGGVRSFPDLHELLRKIFASLRERLPRLTARDGAIVFGQQSIEIHELDWNGGTLRASGRALAQHPFALGLATPGDDFVIALQLPEQGAGAELRWTNTKISGRGTWWEQPFELDSSFAEQGWLPREALVRAQNWDVAAERAKLGAQFERLRGNAELRWQNDGFRLSVRADANPREGRDVPPLRAIAEAQGTTEWFTISALEVKAPFADVTLTAPLEMSYRGEMRSPPARLLVAADLAQQPWFKSAGRIRGEVNLAGANADSRGDFTLRLDALEFAGSRAESAQLRGHWTWPRFELEEFTAQLDATSSVRGRGALDWQRRELNGVAASGKLGREWLTRFLPAALTWRELTFEATAEGALEAPRHAGTLRATEVAFAPVRPLALQAQWRGQERALEEVRVRAEGDGTQLAFAGSLDETRLRVTELLLRAGDAAPLKLDAPAQLSWKPALQISALHLASDSARLHVDARLGAEMNYLIDAAGLDAAWWQRWVDFGGPAWRVNALRSEGRAVRGVLHYSVTLDGAVQIEDRDAAMHAALRGDGDGARVERLDFTTQDQPLTRASGRLPIVVATAPRLQVRLNERAPLEFEAAIAAESPIWALIAELAGVDAAGATAQANLRGSVKDPEGELRVTAPQIRAPTGPLKGKLPALTELNLLARGTRGGLTVENLAVRIEGHPLTSTARLPMSDEAWAELRANPKEFALQRAEARVELIDAELTTLMRGIDNAPLTSGRVTARARLSAGQVDGTVEFSGVATKPLPAFGVIQGMEGRLALRDRVATIETFSALLGGEPLRAEGTVELSPENTLRMNLDLAGRNLPLVRRPGLLVRTDLNLQARTLSSGLTQLSGTVRLRDTLVMADLAAILPGGPRGTARRPPYFSVAAEPFAQWPLDIAVRGPQAVRVRTAVFDGVATPRFQLTGTLGDPRAIGQLNVDSGKVLFPFATFDVQNGTVRLSEADPYTPRLNINAAARRHGYELRVEAEGTLESPRLTFTSNPPLEAAEVLLMVTTGQPPADDAAGNTTGQQRLTRLGTYIGRGIFKNFGGVGSEDRLEITSGEDVSREGRETYQAEYKLNERVSLTGEYDQYDAYNAGIKWRIYTQEEPRRGRRQR